MHTSSESNHHQSTSRSRHLAKLVASAQHLSACMRAASYVRRAVSLRFPTCLCRDLLEGSIPQDGSLLEDAEIKGYVEQYAADQVSVFLFSVFL